MASSWKHQKFAREYFEHGDVRRAIAAIGSKAKNLYNVGHQMLKDPRTQAELAKLNGLAEEKATQTVAETKSEVHSLINEAIDLARTGTPVLNKHGATVDLPGGGIAVKPDISGLLKGAELKGKTVAMFTDRQEIAGEMEGMSNAELEAFFISALISNPMLLKRICQEEIVIRGVHEVERSNAQGRESREGDAAKEAESLAAAPQASGVPQGRVH